MEKCPNCPVYALHKKEKDDTLEKIASPGKIIEGRGGSGSEIDKESEREKREKR